MTSLDTQSIRTDDQRLGDIVEHAVLATEHARELGDGALFHLARGETRERMTRDAMLQCLVVIGLAASALSEERRARYPGITWGRVIALRQLRGKPDRLIDFEYVRRALLEIVPSLLGELR